MSSVRGPAINTPPLKALVDAALAPLSAQIAAEVARLRAVVAHLVGVRDAVCRPVAATSADSLASDAAECAATLREYAAWCGRRGGNHCRSLTRLMRAAMQSPEGNRHA